MELRVEGGGGRSEAVTVIHQDTNHMMYMVVIGTLATVMAAVILVLLVGLFSDNVDNAKVFEILGPAFQTIVGAFVGVIGGRQIGKAEQ